MGRPVRRRLLSSVAARLRPPRSPEVVGSDDDGTVIRRIWAGGAPIDLGDVDGSHAVDVIATEIAHGAYDFSAIDFQPGDVVLDLGAHVGTVSIHLARRHPAVRVIAYEPMPPVFAQLSRNLTRNGVDNVEAHNCAVTADGRDLAMVAHLLSNSGGGTANLDDLDRPGHQRFTVPSTTLDAIFATHGIGRCKLLKIDVEGSEHEILLSTTCLDRIDNIRGEFHENDHLRHRGYSMARLEDHLAAHLPRSRIRYTRCEMAAG